MSRGRACTSMYAMCQRLRVRWAGMAHSPTCSPLYRLSPKCPCEGRRSTRLRGTPWLCGHTVEGNLRHTECVHAPLLMQHSSPRHIRHLGGRIGATPHVADLWGRGDERNAINSGHRAGSLARYRTAAGRKGFAHAFSLSFFSAVQGPEVSAELLDPGSDALYLGRTWYNKRVRRLQCVKPLEGV